MVFAGEQADAHVQLRLRHGPVTFLVHKHLNLVESFTSPNWRQLGNCAVLKLRCPRRVCGRLVEKAKFKGTFEPQETVLHHRRAVPAVQAIDQRQPDEVRVAAIEALDSLGDKRAIPVLQPLLADRDGDVRDAAQTATDSLKDQ
jgi:hypothetical protein